MGSLQKLRMGMTMKQLRRYRRIETVEQLVAWLADEIKNMQRQLREAPTPSTNDKNGQAIEILTGKIESELAMAQSIQKKLGHIMKVQP